MSSFSALQFAFFQIMFHTTAPNTRASLKMVLTNFTISFSTCMNTFLVSAISPCILWTSYLCDHREWRFWLWLFQGLFPICCAYSRISQLLLVWGYFFFTPSDSMTFIGVAFHFPSVAPLEVLDIPLEALKLHSLQNI